VPEVRVVAVDADNVEAVLAVAPRAGQDAWVRPVSWYVARSAYERVWTPWALVADGEVVGFVETAFDPGDASWCIGGVVVDAAQQGRGIGRAAMQVLVDDLRSRPGCRLVALTVHEDNAAARALYRSLGFAETGERDDDELVMVLPAPGPG
jgi:diamine N-acetyltransferase